MCVWCFSGECFCANLLVCADWKQCGHCFGSLFVFLVLIHTVFFLPVLETALRQLWEGPTPLYVQVQWSFLMVWFFRWLLGYLFVPHFLFCLSRSRSRPRNNVGLWPWNTKQRGLIWEWVVVCAVCFSSFFPWQISSEVLRGDFSSIEAETKRLQDQLSDSLKELHQKELRIQQLSSKVLIISYTCLQSLGWGMWGRGEAWAWLRKQEWTFPFLWALVE